MSGLIAAESPGLTDVISDVNFILQEERLKNVLKEELYINARAEIEEIYVEPVYNKKAAHSGRCKSEFVEKIIYG